MKKILPFFLCIALMNCSYAQEVLDQIAEATCKCAEDIDKSLAQEEFELQLGLCMFTAASPLSDELMEQTGIDFNSLYTGGKAEEFGVQVGLKMAALCPETIMRAYDAPEGNPIEEYEEYLLVYVGKINEIDKNQFVSFHVLGEDGKTTKFIWLTEVNTSIDLVNNYKSLINKNVSIQYETLELFDVRIDEYKEFNVLVELSVLD